MNPQNPYQGPPYQQPQQPQQPQPQQPQPSHPLPAPQLAPLSAPASPQQAYPVDYLNQIAPPAQQKTLNRVTVFGLIIGFLTVVGFVMFLLLGGMGKPSITAQLFATRDRVQTLAAVTKEQRHHFGTNELTSLNATLSASLNSMNTDLTTLAGGKNVKNKNKKAIEKEKAYAAVLSQKINDAYLAGTLDRSYATQMAFELRTLSAMINKMRKASKDPAVATFQEKNIPTLDTITKKLTEYSES